MFVVFLMDGFCDWSGALLDSKLLLAGGVCNWSEVLLASRGFLAGRVHKCSEVPLVGKALLSRCRNCITAILRERCY